MTGRSGAAADERGAALLFPFIAIAIVWLYFFGGQYGGVYLVSLRVASMAVAAGVLLLALAAAWRSPRWRPRSSLTPALGIGVAAIAISTVTSRNQRLSFDFVVYSLILAGLYLVLVTLLRDPAIRRRMGALLVALTIAVCAWYLWDVGRDWTTWWGLVGHVVIPSLRPMFEGLTFGNPGQVAAMAVLTGLAAAGHLSGVGRRGWAAMAALAVVVTAVVVISGTRGAWLALAATAAVAAVLGVASSTHRAAVARMGRTRSGRVVAAGLGLAALTAVIVLGPVVLDRILTSGDGGRISYWTAAIRMFGAAPLLGVGPGMWAPERLRATVAPDIDYYIPHAHSVYLNTVAELGLVGLAAGVVIAALTGRLVLQALRGGDRARRRWAAVAILSTVYFGVHQAFDVFVGMPGAVFIFAVPFAWLDATAPEPQLAGSAADRGRWAAMPRPLVLSGGLAAIALIVGWTVWNEGPALRFAAAQAAVDAGDWTGAAADSRMAAVADPSLAPYRLLAGLGALHAGGSGAPDLEAAATLDDMPNAWLDLASVRVAAGDLPGASDALSKAMRLGDQQVALLLPAGAVAERLGDPARADGWYVSALTAMPRLAGSPYWHEPGRAARWPTIASAVVTALDPAGRVEFWLSAGDSARAASAAAEAADPSARQVAQLAVAAWGGDPKALAQLEELARARPKDVTLVGWCARLAARSGDASGAAGYRFWLEVVSPYSSYLGMEVEVSDAARPADAPAGATWTTYGIYTYRRPTIADLLAPGLPHTRWTVGDGASP